MVCIEDLQVRNMSRSAAGSTEKPGKNVRAKSGLNKSILDQGWPDGPPPAPVPTPTAEAGATLEAA